MQGSSEFFLSSEHSADVDLDVRRARVSRHVRREDSDARAWPSSRSFWKRQIRRPSKSWRRPPRMIGLVERLTPSKHLEIARAEMVPAVSLRRWLVVHHGDASSRAIRPDRRRRAAESGASRQNRRQEDLACGPRPRAGLLAELNPASRLPSKSHLLYEDAGLETHVSGRAQAS